MIKEMMKPIKAVRNHASLPAHKHLTTALRHSGKPHEEVLCLSTLKGPKHEIFEHGVFTQIRPGGR
jgi:hypothetical protein